MNTKKLKWAEALVAIVCGFDGWSRNFFGEWNSRLGHKGLTCSLLVQLKTLNRVTTQNSLGPSLVCLVCLVCLVRLSAVPEQNKSRNLWLHFHQSHRTNSLIYKEKEKCIISLQVAPPRGRDCGGFICVLQLWQRYSQYSEKAQAMHFLLSHLSIMTRL